MFVVWCLVFGVWCLAFGVWRLAFGVWRWNNLQVKIKHHPNDQNTRSVNVFTLNH
jgi:hypothetical protein